MIRENILNLRNVTAAQTSDLIINREADMLSLQLTGTATTLNVQVLGRTDPEGNYVAIGGFDQAFGVKNALTSMGVYNFYIGGLCDIKLNVAQVVGGYVNVYVASTRG